MVKPWNLQHFGSGPFPRKHCWKKGQQAKNSIFSCQFCVLLLSRDHKQRRQTHKVFMARNNQNSDNFTVMLGGCCVQKCLSMFVQNLYDFGLRWSLQASDRTKNLTTSNCTLRACLRKVFVLYVSCKNRTISRCSF